MNKKEFSDALNKIEKEERWAEWQKAAEEYGDTKLGTREEYIARFRQNPALEKKYCPALNDRFGCDVKNEQEKITDAAMRTASGTQELAGEAKEANTIAWAALFVSVGSLLVAVFALLKAFGVI